MRFRHHSCAVGSARPGHALCSALLFIACSATSAVPAREITEREAIIAALSRTDFLALETGRHQAAEADVEAAVLLPNPRLSVSREGFTTAGQRTIETSYELSQEIDISGRRALAQGAAAQRLAAVDLETRAERNSTIGEVRKVFGEVLYHQQAVAALTAARDRLAASGRIIGAQADAGEASGYDRRRVARELQGLGVKRDIAQAELARGKAMLAAYVEGADADALRPVGAALPELPAELDTLRAALRRRADLAALIARADAAEHDLRSAQRRWVPDLTVGIGNRSFDQAGPDNNRIMMSLSLPLPVFDRGQPEVKRAAATRESLRASHALELARIEATLEGLWRQAAKLAAAAREFRRESLANTRTLTRIAGIAYAAGESSVIDLIDAYRTELDTELLSLELDYRARMARIELDQLAGVSPHE